MPPDIHCRSRWPWRGSFDHDTLASTKNRKIQQRDEESPERVPTVTLLLKRHHCPDDGDHISTLGNEQEGYMASVSHKLHVAERHGASK